MRSFPRVQDHPSISIKLLRRHRIFDHPMTQFHFTSNGLEIEVMFDQENSFLNFSCRLGSASSRGRIGLVSVKSNIGVRRFFMCPHLVQKTTEIHFIDGSWGSRRAFPLSNRPSRFQRREEKLQARLAQLEGRDGYPKAKGKHRSRLIEKVRSVALVEWRYPSLRTIFADEDLRQFKQRQLRSSRVGAPTGTQQALDLGVQLRDDEVRSRLLDWRERTGCLEPLTPPPLCSHSLESLELRPALDARALAAAGLLNTEVAGHTLIWNDDQGQEAASAVLLIDQQAPTACFVLLQPLNANSQIVEQRVELIRSRTSMRAFLRCPRLGSKHDILFLRDGYFASAKGARLCHNSQRKVA